MSKIIIIVLLLVFIDANFKKIDLLEAYKEGVKECFVLIKPLFVTLMSFMVLITCVQNSGLLDLLKPLQTFFPSDILLLSLLRPLSSSASLSLVHLIFSKYGVDSLIGILASVILCGSDTTLYVVHLYFQSLNLKESKRTLYIGLLMDFIAVILAFILVTKVFA